MPKVSIIIPVYKVERYLPGCLNSVLSQTFQEWEAICVNDGSPDKCGEILAEYAEKDSRIKVITQENKGLSGARNTWLENADGHYILFLDSDDKLPDYAVETLYKIAEETNSPVVVSNRFNSFKEKYPHENYQIIQKDPFKAFVSNRKIHSSACNKIYRKDILQNHRFIEGIYFEDWPFLTEVFADLKSYVITQTPCYTYREDNESIIRTPFNAQKAESYLRGIRSVYEYFGNRPDLRIAQKRMAVAMKMLINKTYKSKDKDLQKAVYKDCRSFLKENVVHLLDLPLKSIFRLWRLK